MVRDDAWFEELFARAGEPLLRYLQRRAPAHAEDVMAEVFLVAWRRRADVPEPPQDLLWLYGVARRQLANTSRGVRRLLRLRARLASERIVDVVDAGDDGDDTESVRAALASLNPADAELLRLLGWEELSHREAASVLGLSENAVALRASRARKKLAAALDRSGVRPDMGGVKA
ncbi:MAG: RNA polymerase sigma factor [Gaiella sp.]